MKIQIEPHTLERAQERGATEDEIRDTIETGFDIPARGNRKGKAKVYDFKQERLGKYYEQKRLEIIYVDEKDVIITITVYVFYGEWKA
jgi:hypothetical protein